VKTAAAAWSLSAAVLAVALASPQGAAAKAPKAPKPPPSATISAEPDTDPDLAAAAQGASSDTVARLADWVLASRDNKDKPFVIVDKVSAEVFVFDADGRMTGSAPALLGLAAGDDSAPGVGDRPLAEIPPQERTTPAGRFVARYGPDDKGEPVVWVDYGAAISLHHVISIDRREHRLQRLKSPSPSDNRITYGCINVPTAFYEAVVVPAMAGGKAVVYVLPDTKPVDEVFPAFGRRERKRLAAEARRETAEAEATPAAAEAPKRGWRGMAVPF
jgi:hypothetical protein